MKKLIFCVFSILSLLVPVFAHADYYNVLHYKGFYMALPGSFVQQEDRDGWFVFQDPQTLDTIEIKYDAAQILSASLAYSLFEHDKDAMLSYIQNVIWEPAEERLDQPAGTCHVRDDLMAIASWGFYNPQTFMFVSKGGVLWIRAHSPKNDGFFDLIRVVTYDP